LLPSSRDQKPLETSDPKARAVANNWLSLLRKGDISRLASRSSVPFYAGDQIVARTQAELSAVLQSMSDEAKESKPPAPAKVYTAAELRKKFGSLPAGVQEGRPRNYAVTKIGGSHFILILETRFGSWRVIGVTQ